MPGYRLSLQDTTSLDAKYLCSRCGDVLRDAVQTSCGHVYCQSCIGTLRGDDGLYTCPIDKDLFASDQIFPDKFMRREILSLEVSCPNSDEGCKWRGEIRHVEKHVLSCPVSKVRCTNPNCPQYVKRADLARHMTTECQYRPEPCSYCADSVTAAVMKHHQAHDCRMYPIACPACEKEGIPRGELASHQNPSTGDCDEIQKRCSFQAIGCRTSKEMKRSEAKRHDDLCAAFHLNLLLSFVLRIEEQVKMTLSVRGAGGFNEGWLRDSERMLSQAIMRIDSIVAETTDLRQKLRNHNDRLGELERKVGYRGNESSLFTSLQPNQMPLDELSRRITNAETNGGNNEALICDTAREVSNTRQEVSSLRTQLDRAVDTIRTLERRLESTEHSLALKNVALADLEEYMRQQEISSYDGTLLWKISDFARRKNDALTGRQASFYSTCFYTSRYGYKMCARMYLNGDGMGKGTHISVFFVVMRGEYDGLLRWPFRQKVTMMLLDQDNVEHVIDAFRPDPSSSSFQRPRREMNVASGCPLFCPLSDLSNHAYVRDDTMFFKIIVDTTDL